MRFVAVVFDTPMGTWLTPTVRVAMPGAPPWLPLALTQAGTSDLAVTVWAFGPGRADLIGATEVLVPPSSQATVNVTTTVKATRPPVVGDVYGCGTDVPSYLVAS